MSLDVSPVLIQQPETDSIDEKTFAEMVRQSLPYAWSIVEKLVYRIHQDGMEWANYAVTPPSEQARTLKTAKTLDATVKHDTGGRPTRCWQDNLDTVTVEWD